VYRRRDAFYLRAKAAGYRSRAAYKLLELAKSDRLFRRGDCVVDLGAWPGGWLQIAAQQVGIAGKIIGVDLRPITPLPDPQIIVVTGDISAAVTITRIMQLCGGHADVVLSDLAPKLTGVRSRDQMQARELAEAALDFAARVLRPGGKFVIKLFMGEELAGYLDRLRECFEHVRTTRPDASRKGSAELYAIASRFAGVARGLSAG